MDQNWIQVGMFLATVGLVAVSVGGVMVSYFLLRSHVDPAVVVYTAHDERRPSLLIIVIENVGASPAYDVRFDLSRPIPQNAWGIEGLQKDEEVVPMREGPLVDGVPVLGPGDRRVLNWGQYGALEEVLGDEPVKISARFESRRSFPWDPTEHVSTSVLEVRSFLATDASEPPDLRGVKALEKISKDLSSIRSSLHAAASILQKPDFEQAIDRIRRGRSGREAPEYGSSDSVGDGIDEAHRVDEATDASDVV